MCLDLLSVHLSGLRFAARLPESAAAGGERVQPAAPGLCPKH